MSLQFERKDNDWLIKATVVLIGSGPFTIDSNLPSNLSIEKVVNNLLATKGDYLQSATIERI